eukprot:2345358-Alexandrium_andersonii.AAC.1
MCVWVWPQPTDVRMPFPVIAIRVVDIDRHCCAHVVGHNIYNFKKKGDDRSAMEMNSGLMEHMLRVNATGVWNKVLGILGSR